MLNQFYKYLLEELILEYLFEANPDSKQRYYYKVYSEENINNLKSALSNSDNKHVKCRKFGLGENIEGYRAYYFEYNSKKLILAFEDKETISNYLVTLRNKIGEETLENEIKDCSILFFMRSNLDSIIDGAKNLSDENLPLSINNITNNIKKKIKQLSSKYNKNLMELLIEKIAEAKGSSIFDFEEVLKCLGRNNLSVEDYIELGVFNDETGKKEVVDQEIRNRIKENIKLYEEVKILQENDSQGFFKNLDGVLNSSGIEELKKNIDKISNVDFDVLYKSMKDLRNSKKIEIEEIRIEECESVIYSIRDTIAGRRVKEVVIFNPNKNKQISLKIFFNRHTLEKNEIKKPNNSSLKKDNKIGKQYLKIDLDNGKEYGVSKIEIGNLKFSINTCILPFEKNFFKDIEYKIQVDETKKMLILHDENFEIENLNFGEKIELMEPYEKNIIEQEENIIKIIDRQEIDFRLKVKEFVIKMGIKYPENNESLAGIISKAYEITTMKFFENEQLKFKNDCIEKKDFTRKTIDSKNSNLKEFLKHEREMIEKKIMYGEIIGNKIEKIPLNINDNIKERYLNILSKIGEYELFTTTKLKLHKKEIEEFLEAYNEEIKNIPSEKTPKNNLFDLLKIGVIKENEKILFSPLHPIQLAYYLEFEEFLDVEENFEKIKKYCERFSPINIVPFYRDIDKKEILQNRGFYNNSNWLIYEKREKDIYSYFLDKVIFEKLKSFTKYFKRLFENDESKPIIINFYGISDLGKILSGILKYKIETKKNRKIIVNIFDFSEQLKYKKLYELERINSLPYSKLSREYDIKIKSSNGQDSEKIFKYMIDSIDWYFREEKLENEYCHLAFVENDKFDQETKEKIERMEDSYSLRGLINGITTTKIGDYYKIGYGNKSRSTSNKLRKLSELYNELLANTESGGASPYIKNSSIAYTIKPIEDEKVYSNANWIVMINPIRGLDSFNNEKTYLLHYSDQYTNSTSYDSITVTKKIDKYEDALKNEIQLLGNFDDIDYCIENLLNYFNFINGEWLLKIDESKLSTIAAAKVIFHNLKNLDNQIIWVPISLEEILRISGNVGLPLNESLHNKKMSACDDLLFLGLDIRDKSKIKMHLFVVEVKVRENIKSAEKEAIDQCKKTYFEILKEDLNHDNKAYREIVRDFYANQFLIAIKKCQLFGIEKNFNISNEVMKKIKNLEFEYVFELPIIGALFLFDKNQNSLDGRKNEYETIEYQENGINYKKKLIKYHYYAADILSVFTKEEMITEIYTPIKVKDFFIDLKEDIEIINVEKSDKTFKKEKKIFLGKDIKNDKNVFWEFGHENLSNRHILITGKSGSGKTYGIQTMLYECSELNIPAIVFDYTSSFTPDHLDLLFKESVGKKINQAIIKKDGFSINPFEKSITQKIGGIEIPLETSDIANRIANTFSRVYKFGDQQKSVLYEGIKNGLNEYGKSMDFSKLKMILENSKDENKNIILSVLSKLSSFFDADIFRGENSLTWKDIIDKKEIFIIQLAGYDRDTQKVIIELILWDIWNYFSTSGKENNPVVLVLDECQNISHSENSASGKILTEGRKFGISGWYATQFLKGNFSEQEIQSLQQAAQKIYYQPNERDIVDVAKFIDITNQEKNYYVEVLQNLNKGECLCVGSEILEGKLKNYKVKKIKITPFTERINLG